MICSNSADLVLLRPEGPGVEGSEISNETERSQILSARKKSVKSFNHFVSIGKKFSKSSLK